MEGDRVSENSKHQLSSQISSLHRLRKPLNITAAKRHSPELVAAVYQVSPYWGWRAALGAAGLSYEVIVQELLPTCPCLICGGEFGLLTGHLRQIHGITPEEYLVDYPHAVIMSEKLRAARGRPGGLIPHWERIWSAEYVLDRIVAYVGLGTPLNYGEMIRTERGLTAAARNYFGSWDKALEAAGLSSDSIREYAVGHGLSEQEICERLQERWEAGRPLHMGYMQTGTENVRLLNAGRRHYGSWRAALAAAGIPADRIQRKRAHYTQGDVDALHGEARRVVALPDPERMEAVRAMHARYRWMVPCRYGGWRKFAAEIGVPPRRLLAIRFPDRRSVLEEARAWQSEGRKLERGILVRENRGLYEAIGHHFTSFDAFERRLAAR